MFSLPNNGHMWKELFVSFIGMQEPRAFMLSGSLSCPNTGIVSDSHENNSIWTAKQYRPTGTSMI